MEYKLDEPGVNELVLVDVDILLARLKSDCPEFFVSPDTKNEISLRRIDSCINYMTENKIVTSPLLFSENGLIGVIDGRHRIIAAKKMGYQHICVEVPQDQKKLFLNLI